MSTKKKLIELVGKIAGIEKEERSAFSQINAYEIAQDKPKLLKELSKLYEELQRKKNTPITKELLEKNGAKYERVENDDDCSPYHFYRFQFPLLLERVGEDFFIDGTDIELKTVADLEDAMDLCGIDKDIEL